MSVSLVDGHIDSDAPRMTDNEIIKALECHKNETNSCIVCPYSYSMRGCSLTMASDALDLINRQKAEIERLQEVTENLQYEYDLMRQEKAVVEAEAIKEFAERLKDYYIKDKRYKRPHASTMIIFLFDLIDKLVKEMVGAESG